MKIAGRAIADPEVACPRPPNWPWSRSPRRRTLRRRPSSLRPGRNQALMCTRSHLTFAVIAGALATLLAFAPTLAQQARAAAKPSATAAAPAPADGQKGFDFEFGRWHSHIKRLKQPLSGSK